MLRVVTVFLLLTGLCLPGYAQITSIASGDWSNVNNWSCTCVPSSTDGLIRIQPTHTITVSDSRNADELVVSGDATLVIANGGNLSIRNGTGDDLTQEPADPDNAGTLNDAVVQINSGGIIENQGFISSIKTAITFASGSTYQHNQSNGIIVDATWSAGSTCSVTGWTSAASNSAFQNSLSQSFSNFTWNCPSQTQASVLFNGKLNSVGGTLTISNTGNTALAPNRGINLGFTSNTTGSMSIGSDFIVSGPSKLTFSSAGTFTVTVNGNASFSSTALNNVSTPNHFLLLSSSGTITLTVVGNFTLNSGQFNTSNSTLAAGTGTVNIGGDFNFVGGSIHKSGSLGVGNVNFNKNGTQNYTLTAGTFTANQPITYTVAATSTLNLGTQVFGAATAGTFVNNGTVILGSTSVTGAIAGNIALSTTTFNAGSNIVYRSSSAQQYIDITHPTTAGVNSEIDNSFGVNLLAATTFGGNLTVTNGSLNAGANTFTIGGNLTVATAGSFTFPTTLSIPGNITFASGSTVAHNNGTLTLTGTGTQTIDAAGKTLNNITVNKSVGTNVTLSSALSLIGRLNVNSTNSAFNSGGFLTLISTSDGTSGNASIGPLLNGTSVSGTVNVQRFMSAEGRIYRYISSPVTATTIASLQSDFPITGNFTTPSTCTGCISSSASMFYYDAATAAYVAYPVASNTETLTPGRGYAAFIRQDILPGGAPVTTHYAGTINQGAVSLPVVHNGVVAQSWNLVGNPYPASIDWDTGAGWTKTNINGSVTVRDNGTGTFKSWNGSTGSLTNGEIAAGQGIWVQTTAASPVLTINENAKTTVTGTFYREAAPDVIVMTVSNATLTDAAYVQLHPDAKSSFDYYDATKMPNDRFDFATRFANTTALSINATNTISCDAELLSVMRFTKNSNGTYISNPVGSYSLAFEFQGSLFNSYFITMTDQFTGTQKLVTPGMVYNFSITSDVASLREDRFKFTFKDNIDTSFDVLAPSFVCDPSNTEVTVQGSQIGNQYYLVENGNTVSSTLIGDGGVIRFAGNDLNLTLGTHTLSVAVKTNCSSAMLIKTVSFNVDSKPTAVPVSASRCQSGSVSLTSAGAPNGGTYAWYASSDSSTPLSVSNSFTTPVLSQTTTYFVAARTSSGCEGQKVATQAHVVTFENARITKDTQNQLRSNYSANNQWSLNGTIIPGATSQEYTAAAPGTYTLTVNVGDGCTTTDQFEFIVTGLAEEQGTVTKVYPNPARQSLFIEIPHSISSATLSVYNTTGQQMNVGTITSVKDDVRMMSVENLAPGIYLLRISTNNLSETIKFQVNRD